MEDSVPASEKLVITQPAEGSIFRTPPGENTFLVKVSGKLDPSEVKQGRKLLVIIRTDKDYPQGLFEPPPDGIWQVPRNRLGGVYHRIFAVLLDYDGEPIFRSATVSVTLMRGVGDPSD